MLKNVISNNNNKYIQKHIMKNLKTLSSLINQPEERRYRYMYSVPPRSGRYIVLDTETTGLGLDDHIVEIGAHEIVNGRLSGNQFHLYIRPRKNMSQEVINVHRIDNNFYDEFYKDVYNTDEKGIRNFMNWVGTSLIFAHNAPFDMGMLNSELIHWNMPIIPDGRFRCTMRIFAEIYGKINPEFEDKFTKLVNCCELLGLKSYENEYHNALFDAFMTARLMCTLYDLLDEKRYEALFKNVNYSKKTINDYFKNVNNNLNNNYNNFNKNNYNSNYQSQANQYQAMNSHLEMVQKYPSTNEIKDLQNNLNTQIINNSRFLDQQNKEKKHIDDNRSKSTSSSGNQETTLFKNIEEENDEARSLSQDEINEIMEDLI